MKLRVIREPSAAGATIGALYIDGVWAAWTLEDELRAVKVPGQTAIPAGTYTVRLTNSPRFERVLPELLEVPGFVGIRIHAGNRKEDTEGCILVGRHRGDASIAGSRLALGDVMAKLAGVGDITITIEELMT